MSDEAERTLCQLPFVHVFRIPVRKSAGTVILAVDRKDGDVHVIISIGFADCLQRVTELLIGQKTLHGLEN
jgi:hypothetical protein